MPAGYGSKSIYAVSGAALVTQFSDPLNVVDPNSGTGLSQNWVQAIKTHYPLVDPVQSSTAIITPSSFDAANALVWRHEGSGAANTNWAGLAMPVKGGINQNIFGKRQFAQCTFLKLTSTWRSGLTVMTYASEANGLTCYELELTNIATTWFIQGVVADSFSVLASGSDVFTGGDVLRLSADPSVAGQVTIIFSKNGVAISTIVDSSASRITIGSPALHSRISSSTGASEWRTFSCGAGL